MLNQITIHGRLTKDPELRKTQAGKSVTSFNVAVDRDYQKDGKKEADFIDCSAWEQKADFVKSYFTKGQEILVSGRLQSRKWKDKDGKDRIAWEIQVERVDFCGSKGHAAPATAAAPGEEYPELPEDDGDLPF